MNKPAKNDSPLGDISGEEPLMRAQVEMILDTAQKMGATAAEVSVGQDVGLSVTARMGELETVEGKQERGGGITVYLDDCKGVASTSEGSLAVVSGIEHL